MNLVLTCRNSAVETMTLLKELEYITKGHVATQTILLQILKRYYSLVSFSSLVL